MPVVDGDGRLVGVCTRHDLLSARVALLDHERPQPGWLARRRPGPADDLARGPGVVTEGGDPACWLDRVCPACGRLDERPAGTGHADRCSGCGAAIEREGGPGQDDRGAAEPRPGGGVSVARRLADADDARLSPTGATPRWLPSRPSTSRSSNGSGLIYGDLGADLPAP